MPGGSMDTIVIDIRKELEGLPYTPSKPCIFRVDKNLRSDACENIYEPEIIAIGPYHHGNPRLENMQKYKLKYLKRLLERKKEERVDKYVTSIAKMEERARQYYSEPFDNLEKSEFVKVMLRDGCFLIELFRYLSKKIPRDVDDPIFIQERILGQLRHDIFLLENQLPFFVLNQLFNMTKTPEDSDTELITLALKFADGAFLNFSHSRISESLQVREIINIDHLVGLMHHGCCLPFLKISSNNNEIRDNGDNINSISGLQKFGIKFRKAKGNVGGLLNITFVDGELRIPQLSIYDETESQLRNLIAYEQYFPNGKIRFVSDYIFFMQCLINNSQDVEVLRSRGIIENCLGDDEKLCLMFNRLGKNTLTSSIFGYSQVFSGVNRQCSRPTKKWLANLRMNYFNSPWSIIKFIAAVALLLLTFTQTAYTVLAYYEGPTHMVGNSGPPV